MSMAPKKITCPLLSAWAPDIQECQLPEPYFTHHLLAIGIVPLDERCLAKDQPWPLREFVFRSL